MTAPGTTEGMLDVLASEARTALDDPAALGLPYEDGVNDYDPTIARAFAIDRLDDIINALNPSEETRKSYARTLKVLGRHIAERQDAIELSYRKYDSETAKTAYAEAHEALTLALDYLDTAIGALAPEGT